MSSDYRHTRRQRNLENLLIQGLVSPFFNGVMITAAIFPPEFVQFPLELRTLAVSGGAPTVSPTDRRVHFARYVALLVALVESVLAGRSVLFSDHR